MKKTVKLEGATVLKPYTFIVYTFNNKTKEIKLTAKLKTKPVSKTRLLELIAIELAKDPNSCYEVL